jgi:hypothetical protein
MAKTLPHQPFRAFRFEARLGSKSIPLSEVNHRPEGLIIGVAHVADRETLFSHFYEYNPESLLFVELLSHTTGDVEAGRVEVRGQWRNIVYELGEGARHLAVSCDSIDGGVAFDRVLFPNARLIALKDGPGVDDRILIIREKLTDAKAMGYRINVKDDTVRELHTLHGIEAVDEFERSIDEMIAIEEFIKVGGLSVEEATTKASAGERPTTGWFAPRG